jgi:uncharacterized membrane protein YcaP (DUF421 family)
LDAVLNGMAIYVVLLLLFRLAGKRSLAQASVSDLLLLLILGEAIQQAVVGRENYSVVVSAALIVVLLGLIRLSDYLGTRTRRDETAVHAPIVLVEDGEPLPEQMTRARVTEQDIITHARRSQGVERIEQIKYAVLDKTGDIAIVPRI